MPAYAVIGGQWGDEGKGKVVDYLARDMHIVARYAGGNNAGHTVITEKGQFAFHLVPAGILWPHVTCIIGHGMVVDPDVLIGEMENLERHGIDMGRLQISDRAHLIMPYHVALDRMEEASRGKGAIGTTGKGVGPAYVDKVGRMGIRMGELLDLDALLPRLKAVLEQKNRILTQVYGAAPFSLEEVYHHCRRWGERLGPFIAPVEVTIRRALSTGQRILLEGAQGSLLDIDHGTYPYVTSSHPTVGGACTGLGLPPSAIQGVIGVYKAYTTRVGGGPMPTELTDAVGDTIRERAWEYGTTTGRPRRCGWFDAVAARYSAMVNGVTWMVLTRLDVLDGFHPVRLCVAYQMDGKTIDHFPSSAALLGRCTPVYEDLPGWDRPTAGLTSWEELPPQAQRYALRLQELVGCPIAMISTGPRRHETIEMIPIR
jgi:adenylosuccinate synthase